MKDLVLPEIEAYAEAHSAAESEVCRALREETHETMDLPQMLVGPLEGAFLKVMVRLVSARSVLEVGMFTGYSALCMAEALPEDGRVTTLEIEPKHVALGRKYFERSAHGGKIDVRVGPALDTLRELTGPYDVIFIDADKANYLSYYRRARDLVSPQGVILIDNVLWSGEVLQQPAPDASTGAIQELNRLVADDPGVSAVLLTIRDGVLVVKPKDSAAEGLKT